MRNKARSRTKKKKLIEIKQRLEIGFAGIETVFGIGPVSISGQFVSDELGGKIGRNFVRASVWTPPRFLATSDAFSRHYYSPFLLLLAALVSSLFDREHYFSFVSLSSSARILVLFLRVLQRKREREDILVPRFNR